MKVVVGTNTIVKKVTVGTPLRVGSAANGSLTGLDDVNGSINLADGTILQYDSATGKFNHVPASTIAGPDIHATYDSNAIGTLTYNDSTGAVRLIGPTSAQIRALFSAHPSANNILQYDSAAGTFYVETQSLAFDSNFAAKTTDDLAEGSNLYFTDSRGRGAISVTDTGGFGSLTYNSASGEITYTGPSVAETRSVINVGDNLAYDSTTGKITFTGTLNPGINDGDITGTLEVVSSGDYGSLSYDDGTGTFTFVGVNDSDIRGSISVSNSLLDGLGSISFDEISGTIQYTGVSPQEIRNQLSASGDLQYNSTTGEFSIITGAHYTDSDARNAFSVNFIGDTAFDSSPYGGASYDASTGVLTINGTTDSNIRNSLTIQDSGGLGSLNYFVKQGRIVYKGPEVADVAGLLSASEDSLSMGNFYLDSNTGHFHFKLEDDSVRSLFTVHSDDEGGASLRYDSATGVFTFSGPSTLDLRQQLSVDSAANIGDGSFTYDDSFGIFTYIGPVAAETRAHFAGGLGIDYNESTGTFRLDSSANIVTGSIVTGQLTVTDSAVINQATISNRLFVDSISSIDSTQSVFVNGQSIILISGDDGRILLDTPALHSTDKSISLSVDDSNIDNINGGGIIIGAGSNVQAIIYNAADDQFRLTSGLNVPGELTGTTIDSINKRIDELPDSAQMKGILSAGPGLSYDNVNGIYRITSSGVVPGIYGTATQVPNITVDSLGQIDSIGLIPMSTVEAIAFDSATGQITLTTATDSYHTVVTLDPYSTTNLVEGDNLYYTRARFDSALGDNASRTQIRTYIDSAAGTEPFKDTVRGYFSVNDLGGQGALTYDSDTGQITYTGAVIRKAGNGLDLDSDTGTFRTDSTADVIFNSVQASNSVTTVNLSTDSASTKILRFDPNQWTDVNVPDNIPWPRQEGDLFYFQGPDALTYSNDKINVKIGQDEIVRVINNTGVDIAKGKAVYVTGAINDFPSIALAKADTFETVYTTAGLTSNYIANGDYGYVTVRGLYGGLNTAEFTPGDIVHVSPDSAGELVAYSPTYPNYAYQMGTVLVADSATGGNVGGCIQVNLQAEVFENIRTQGNSRIGGNLTVVGDLNILGAENVVTVANLAVTDNFVYLGAGDTVTAQALDSGLNDLSFLGHYNGDSNLTYYVKISAIDPAGDTIVWSFDSDFATLQGFDSVGGPTSYDISGTLPVNLRYGISVDFEAITGHALNERWKGVAAPFNEQLGIIGNYNTPTDPYAHTGIFRDASDQRFKFFNGYRPEIEGSINTSDSTYEDAPIQFSTGYGDIVGNLTGNVTGTVSSIANHSTADLVEDPAATDSSGTQYFTSARARATIQAVDAGGDGSFVYDSATGTMTYTGPSEAEFYQHFKDNADSWGDMTFDSAYGTNGGFKLHERHITRHEEVYADSFITSQEYFLVYSGTTGGTLKKVRADTLASTIGGGAGGGGGGGLFGYINL
jgi:hypothetical protein